MEEIIKAMERCEEKVKDIIDREEKIKQFCESNNTKNNFIHIFYEGFGKFSVKFNKIRVKPLQID